MKSFFINRDLAEEDTVSITGDLWHHIHNVMRLRSDDRLILKDGKGHAYIGCITAIADGACQVYLESKSPVDSEPPFEIDLYQALPKGSRFEYILEKGCEIGISNFIPLLTDRTVKILNEDRFAKKRFRWENILKESARQSGRALIPGLKNPLRLKDMADKTDVYSHRFVAWENSETSIGKVLKGCKQVGKIMLLIGPEGGFAPSEIIQLKQWGVNDFSLGPRILRCDTAGLVASSILLYQFGAMEV